ncbi:hypothetical protein BCR36DRAFT_20552 [Piromyces finnis]|uniref:Uncharacterized protein n=1 Tax=Piromyces finnis TaxID=1754191 RepID=A0A1Y1VDX8_9FUNG|nr:hypothetical protein BCR36DRAFT_20552 [Piromyces finnis]|eukprot:ORX53768.1 hypothetical protein BCR36DRAFT_20552 [Piromyces finnis]
MLEESQSTKKEVLEEQPGNENATLNKYQRNEGSDSTSQKKVELNKELMIDQENKCEEKTLLHDACLSKEENINNIKFLVEEKEININSIDKNGCTALMYALKNGHNATAKYLMENEENTCIKDKNGNTLLLLYYACLSKKINKDAIRYIVEKLKVDINSQDKFGMTPLMYAVQNQNQDIVKYLIERKPDIDIIDNDGWSYLHYACKYGLEDLIKYLIKNLKI